MNSPFMWFIFFWVFVMVGLFAIGGYFMFRKFLKSLPMADGKSKLDWQNYYVEQSRHLWTDESRAFLEKLVSPVPRPFRDVARHSIAAKIGELALKENAAAIDRDLCIRGYIMATPKRDYRSLLAFLEKEQIDCTPYRHLFEK